MNHFSLFLLTVLTVACILAAFSASADQNRPLDLSSRESTAHKLFIAEVSGESAMALFQKESSEWGPFSVMGYTEKQVMEMVNNPNGQACSEKHNQGDLANRYCHASVVKAIDRSLQYYGVSRSLSALLAGAVFLPKEYLLDKNPSKSDLVIADYAILDKSRTRIEVTAFADGAVFVVLRKRLNF